MSNTRNLADLLKVCSILPALAIMPAMAGTGLENIGILDYADEWDLYTMNSNGTVGSFSGYDASEREEASVIFVGKGQELSISDGAIIEDNIAQVGGAIAITGKQPAATLNIGKDVKFLNNTAWFDGGAIANFGNTIVANGVLFQGNIAQIKPEDNANQIGGGALSLGATSKTTMQDTNFIANESYYNGGAIGTRLAETTEGGHNDNSTAILNIKGGTFVSNKANGYLDAKGKIVAGNGGAIYNTFYADVAVDNVQFDDNYAAQNGGAIYNDGTKDLKGSGAVMTINGSEFENNIAAVSGGAIYNTGDLTIKNGDFENNKVTGGDGDGGALYTDTGALTLIDTDFSENYTKDNAEGDRGYGGAIYAQGGTIDIQGGEYEDNHALTGGAIYVSRHATSVNIENVEFDGNWASDIGALGIFGKNTTLTNLTFTDNYTTGQYAEFDFNDGGGALFFGAEAQAVLDNGTFVSNKSAAVGGAIATRGPNKGNNSAAKLDIKNSTFRENVAATQGGAIYTAFYNSQEAVDNVYLANSVFVANKANEGGAIYNEGLADYGNNFASIYISDVTFKDNSASTNGGAIFNGAGATINLSGANVFSGNAAGKYNALNDIHNLGTLNIVDGTTTFGGGVSGIGGTFTLAQGATLDIGTSTIKQGTIELNGNVIASLVNNQRGNGYGRFDAGKITVGGTAQFTLNVGAVGTYNIWGDATVNEDQITVGDIYEIAGIDGNGVEIVTKSVDTIAEEKGISTQAAGAVAGLANANSGKAHEVSLALQDALNGGDVAYVERETKKLNPTDKPVAQAATTSVQNQVLALTSGRMAGGISVGRAGGDAASQENGFWIQGLFNKSKFADEFHGYTRGVALGADTLIDKKWTIGGGLAFNNSDVHADSAHTDIDSKTLFLYGQYKPNNWFVNATATYSMSEYTENKTVAGISMSDTYDVDSYGAQVMTGYDFAPGITTEAGLRYLHIAQDAYTQESGASVSALDTDFLSGVAGVKYAFAIENDWAIQLRPELRAAMTYDFISDDATATVVMPGVASYKVDGERLSRMGGEFGIGLTAQYKGMEVSLMYDLDLHQDYTSQTGMIKFRGQF